MVTGWKWINGSCYYFDGSGVMQSSKWIDGNYVDAEGNGFVARSWVPFDMKWGERGRAA